jgi:hypothetical protein
MWPYDETIDPPAPFVDVLVSPPVGSNLSETLRAKLDTAADISCIPADLVARLGILPVRTILIEGHNGVQMAVDTYVIILEVAGTRFRHLEVVSILGEYALLGRDVLNSLYVRLDGPGLTFYMSVSP